MSDSYPSVDLYGTFQEDSQNADTVVLANTAIQSTATPAQVPLYPSGDTTQYVPTTPDFYETVIDKLSLTETAGTETTVLLCAVLASAPTTYYVLDEITVPASTSVVEPQSRAKWVVPPGYYPAIQVVVANASIDAYANARLTKGSG